MRDVGAARNVGLGQIDGFGGGYERSFSGRTFGPAGTCPPGLGTIDLTAVGSGSQSGGLERSIVSAGNQSGRMRGFAGGRVFSLFSGDVGTEKQMTGEKRWGTGKSSPNPQESESHLMRTKNCKIRPVGA